MTASCASSELTRSFEARNLDPAEFRHRDHVQVAFELLQKYDFIDAAAIYAKGVRSIASRAGASRKFNLTITYAFMSLIAESMIARPYEGFPAFVAANPDLMSKELLIRWYATDRLQSEAARGIFLMPEPALCETEH